MECRRFGNELTPPKVRSFDCEDGDDRFAEWMEFMDDEPSTNLHAGCNVILAHGDSEPESSPGSLSTSSASSPNQCEQEHGNSPGVSLPLQEGIRRRLTVKQKRPPAYQQNNSKYKGCKTVIEDKGFGIAWKHTKQERKQLHNQSQSVLMRTLIKAVGIREIRAGQNWGNTRQRARQYWSRLNPDKKHGVLLKASKDVVRGSPEEKAIQSLADGYDMVGNRYRRNRSICAADRAPVNCCYKSRAILVTYQSQKLVLATLDEWRELTDSLLVEQLKADRDILQLIDIAGQDVDAMQKKN